jgi:hypothetical protein
LPQNSFFLYEIFFGSYKRFLSPNKKAANLLRVTLDEGPRSRYQWTQVILLLKSFKLVPRHSDKGARPKSGKLRLNLHGTWFGGKINRFRPKNSAKRELLIWRTKNQARDQGTIQLKDSICFKLVQIGYQEIGPWTLI